MLHAAACRHQILRASRGVRDDHRQAGRHRFIHHQPPFLLETRQDKRLRQRIENRVLLNLAESVEVDRAAVAFYGVFSVRFTVLAKARLAKPRLSLTLRTFADCPGHRAVGIPRSPIGCKPLGLIRVNPC